MNILFINKFTQEVGGVECYINALSERLRDKGHRTGIVHRDELAGDRKFDAYYKISELWEKELTLQQQTSGRLKKAIEDFSPDVVYLQSIDNGKAVSFISGLYPTVQYMHGYKAVDPDGKMLLKSPMEVNTYPLSPACFMRAYTRGSMPRSPVKAVKAYLRAKRSLEAAKRLKGVIVSSGYMKETLVKNGLSPEKVKVLPYFIDYSAVDGDVALDRKRILFAGRLVEAKGLGELLDILTLVKEDFILDVAGTGPDEGALKQKTKDLGLADKVVFHEWVAHKDLLGFYKRCLFLAVPSVWPEPFGICGIEAAYFGRPAVVFNVGGISDWLVDGETGFLVEPYNKKKMAEKIDHLLSDPETAKEMGARAKELAVKKYSPEAHVEKLLGIFNEL